MAASNKKIISLGSGKGGVGKSFIAANLGTILAQRHKNIALVDTNVGGSNLHTFLGIALPEKTLGNFIHDKQANLESVLVTNPHSEALLISGASDILALSTPSDNQRQRLFRELEALDCDILFLDLPTGCHAEIVDAFMLSNDGLIVLDSMPTTLESTFLFLKNVAFRIFSRFFNTNRDILSFIEEAFNPNSKLGLSTVHQIFQTLETLDKDNTERASEALSDFRPSLIVNSIKDKSDRDIIDPFQKLVQKYLSVHMQYLGSIAFGAEVDASIGNGVPIVIDNPECQTSLDIKEIAEKLL
jgi:flagellar biosynthesis protein FlhG